MFEDTSPEGKLLALKVAIDNNKLGPSIVERAGECNKPDDGESSKRLYAKINNLKRLQAAVYNKKKHSTEQST